ncbi:Aminopeptidase N-1 [Operophtera brumata]|uniref:Aminopeptidase N-1 n=1 Tax=Operophtera brumata TaxID=104452 RepID=A0A0L7LCL5_OPEBR|nr:Aminopeptidase N-1 [Operophtera brumata]
MVSIVMINVDFVNFLINFNHLLGFKMVFPSLLCLLIGTAIAVPFDEFRSNFEFLDRSTNLDEPAYRLLDNVQPSELWTKFDVSDIEIPENVVLADSEFNKPGEISFLISADIFFNIILPDKINLARHKLFLLATKYGYIVSGNIEKGNVCLSSQNISSESVILHATVNEDKVDSLIQKFWEEQHTPEIKHENTNDRLDICETSFQNSVQLKNKRFQFY